MQDIENRSKTAKSTAMVLLNTRNIAGYQSVKDMLKTDAKGAWGNQITFLHVDIPKLKDSDILEALQFIREVHYAIKKKKNSFGVLLTGRLLQLNHKLRGHEVGLCLQFLFYFINLNSFVVNKK